MKVSIGPASLVVALATVFSGQAMAGLESHQVQTNSVGNCQGALPVYETNLRKRPLSVVNEGTRSSFVSCAFTSATDFLRPADGKVVNYFGAFFINNSSADQTVTCTGVVGFENGADTYYQSGSAVVPANRASDAAVFFDAPPSPDTAYYQLVSMSCNLPVGVGISDNYVSYIIDDAT